MKTKIKNEVAEIEKKIDELFQEFVHETVIQREIALYNKFHTFKDKLKDFFIPERVKEKSVNVVEDQSKEESK